METPRYTPAADRYDRASFCRAGNSGILLPRISLGLWKNFGSDRPFDTARRIVETAFDHGITHFDLANNYGPPYGAAEETFGRILRTSLRPWRDELFIASKAGYDMWPGPYGNWGSRKYLMASLDQSLRRMGLDYVDLFYSHRYDPHTPLDETLQTLVDIVRAGKALYVGLSRWPRQAAAYGYGYLAARDVPCLVYQGRLNLLDRAPETEGITADTQERGIGFVSFSPLAQGLLTERYLHSIPADSRMNREASLRPDVLTDALRGRLMALNGLAQRRGNTLAQMALRWVLDRPGVTSVIVGASSPEQLLDSLHSAECVPLDNEEIQAIEAILA